LKEVMIVYLGKERRDDNFNTEKKIE